MRTRFGKRASEVMTSQIGNILIALAILVVLLAIIGVFVLPRFRELLRGLGWG